MTLLEKNGVEEGVLNVGKQCLAQDEGGDAEFGCDEQQSDERSEGAEEEDKSRLDGQGEEEANAKHGGGEDELPEDRVEGFVEGGMGYEVDNTLQRINPASGHDSIAQQGERLSYVSFCFSPQ